MNLAPILLFVYSRPQHTLAVLEALMYNVLASESILYIYCDGAKKSASLEDLKKIEDVRKVVRQQQWCKAVKIIERTENLGLANSVINGVTEVIEKHGKVIVLEDDILTGKYFLKFMNEGLELYKDEKDAFGVSGYKYPSFANIDCDTYFLPIASSWSYGTWLDRWRKVNFNGNELLMEINTKGLKHNMNFGNYPFYEMLEDQIKGLNNSWAIRFYASMFLNGGLFLYPNKSLVKNLGFDGSGTHCGVDDFFSKISITHKLISAEKINVSVNSSIVKVFKKSFKSKNSDNLKLIKVLKNFKKRVIKRFRKMVIKE